MNSLWFKKIIPFFLCAVFFLTVAGCGKSSLSPSEIVENVKNSHHFSALNPLTGDKLSAYFQFSDSDVKRFCVYISGVNESADIIASFELKSEENKAKILNGISLYLNNKSKIYKGNLETEYQKIQNRVLMQIGSSVTLVVCEDYSAVETQLKKLGGQLLA